MRGQRHTLLPLFPQLMNVQDNPKYFDAPVPLECTQSILPSRPNRTGPTTGNTSFQTHIGNALFHLLPDLILLLFACLRPPNSWYCVATLLRWHYCKSRRDIPRYPVMAVDEEPKVPPIIETNNIEDSSCTSGSKTPPTPAPKHQPPPFETGKAEVSRQCPIAAIFSFHSHENPPQILALAIFHPLSVLSLAYLHHNPPCPTFHLAPYWRQRLVSFLALSL